MKRLYYLIMIIISISTISQMGSPSLSFGECRVVNQTNKLLKAIKEKNFWRWSALCEEIQEDLYEIRRSYPKFDLNKRKEEYLKIQYKGFVDSYNTIYLVIAVRHAN